MSKEPTKFATLEQYREMYSAEAVAEKLLRKTYLYGQTVACRKRKTVSDGRHLRDLALVFNRLFDGGSRVPQVRNGRG